MKSIFRLKYPKLILLALTFVIAYELFVILETGAFYELISSLGYVGTFIAGILFSYGFTAAPATALFLVFGQEQVWWLAALVGASGSVIGNLLIFHVVRYSVNDEITRLEKTHSIKTIEHAVPRKLKHFIVPVLAGFIMASPLPDEVAISLFALTHRISTREFIVVSLLLHLIGIMAIIGIGAAL